MDPICYTYAAMSNERQGYFRRVHIKLKVEPSVVQCIPKVHCKSASRGETSLVRSGSLVYFSEPKLGWENHRTESDFLEVGSVRFRGPFGSSGRERGDDWD